MADPIASATLSLDPSHLEQLSNIAGDIGLIPDQGGQQEVASQPSAPDAPSTIQEAVPQAPGNGEGGLDPALVEALKGMKDIQPGETAQPGMNPALMPETPKVDPNAEAKKKGNVIDDPLNGFTMGVGRNALPTTAGFFAGARAGKVAINAIDAATKMKGPWQLRVGAGVAAGLFTAWGVTSGTKWLQDLVGEAVFPGFKQREEDSRKSKLGEAGYAMGALADNLITMKINPEGTANAFKAAKMLITAPQEVRSAYFATAEGKQAAQDLFTSALGATLQGGPELLHQLQSPDPKYWIALAYTIAGAAFTRENKLGRGLSGNKEPVLPTKEETKDYVREADPEAVSTVLMDGLYQEAYDHAVQTGNEEMAARIVALAQNAKDPNQGMLPLNSSVEGGKTGGFKLEGEAGATPAPVEQPIQRTDNLVQDELPLSTDVEQGRNGEFKLEGETGAAPKPLTFDESGQSSFDFFGELAQREPSPETAVSGAGETPVAEPTAPGNQPELDFSQRVKDLAGQKVKATFQGETGFLEVQGDTLVLRKPRSKTVYEVGPADPEKPLSQFEGLEVVQQKARGKAASPAENSANALVKQEGNPTVPKSKLEAWADKTIEEIRNDRKGRFNSFIDPVEEAKFIAAAAVKGAYHISRGAKQFGTWAAQMIKDYGESIRPHLASIWSKAQEIHANPQLGADIKTAQESSKPVVNATIKQDPEVNTIFQKYINGDASTLIDAAKLAGDLNLNTYDPNVNAQKLIASVATTIQDQIRTAKGPSQSATALGTEAAALLRDAGMKGVLKKLEKEASREGYSETAYVKAYQALLVDSYTRLREKMDIHAVTNTDESSKAVNDAYAHYKKIQLAFEAKGSEQGKAFAARKMSVVTLKAIEMALNAENPFRALNRVEMTLTQKTLGAASEILANTVLSPVSASSSLVSNGILNLYKPIEMAMGHALTGDMGRAGEFLKSYGYMAHYFGDAVRLSYRTFLTGEPHFTSHTSISEIRSTAVNRDQYQGKLAGVNQYRSPGYISSEVAGVDPKNGPLSSTFAGLIDAVGEYFRVPQRLILPADELFKVVGGMARAKVHYTIEAKESGITDPKAVAEYVGKKMDDLVDSNGSLFSKENIIKQAQEDVKRRGLTGMEAVTEAYRIAEERMNSGTSVVAKMVKDYAEENALQATLASLENGKPTVAKSIYGLFKNHPIVRLSFAQYFISTPVNGFRQIGQRMMPGALLLRNEKFANNPLIGPTLKRLHVQNAADLASGDPDRIASAVGKQATGMLLTTIGGGLALYGGITGAGPQNTDSKKLLQATRWLPYSLVIDKNSTVGNWIKESGLIDSEDDKGNYYVQYSRLDPLAGILGLFADFTDAIKSQHLNEESGTDEKVGSIAYATAIALGRLVTERASLKGIKDALTLIDPATKENPSDYIRAFQTYFNKRAANVVVPATPSKLLRVDDDYLTEARTFAQNVAARIGQENVKYLNDTFGTKMYIPPQRNILGEPTDIPLTTSSAFNIVNPMLISGDKNDKVLSEMVSLMHDFKQAPRFHSPKGANDILDARDFYNEKGQDAYDRKLELMSTITDESGATLRQTLSDLIQSEAYQSLPSQDDVEKGFTTGRVDLIQAQLARYAKLAEAQVMQENFARPDDKLKYSEIVPKTIILKKASKTMGRKEANQTANDYIQNILNY